MKFTTLTTLSTLTTLGLASPVLHWHRQVNSTTVRTTNGTATAITAPLTTGVTTEEITIFPKTPETDATAAASVVSEQIAAKLLDVEALLGLSLGEVLATQIGAYVGRFNAMMSTVVMMAGVGEGEGKEGVETGAGAEPIVKTEPVVETEPEVVIEARSEGEEEGEVEGGEEYELVEETDAEVEAGAEGEIEQE